MRLIFLYTLVWFISNNASAKGIVKPNFVPYCTTRDKCRLACTCEVVPNCEVLDLDDVARKSILNYHNQIRDIQSSGEPIPGGMTMLQYDENLEQISKCWAARCEDEYSECFITPEFNETSQAVVQITLQQGDEPKVTLLMQMMNSWLGQAQVISVETLSDMPGEEEGAKIHNFAQLLSDRVLYVGCAWSRSEQVLTFVCTYGPRGPIQGDAIFKIGRLCTLCPENYACDYIKPFSRLCKAGPNVHSTVQTPPAPPPMPPQPEATQPPQPPPKPPQVPTTLFAAHPNPPPSPPPYQIQPVMVPAPQPPPVLPSAITLPITQMPMETPNFPPPQAPGAPPMLPNAEPIPPPMLPKVPSTNLHVFPGLPDSLPVPPTMMFQSTYPVMYRPQCPPKILAPQVSQMGYSVREPMFEMSPPLPPEPRTIEGLYNMPQLPPVNTQSHSYFPPEPPQIPHFAQTPPPPPPRSLFHQPQTPPKPPPRHSYVGTPPPLPQIPPEPIAKPFPLPRIPTDPFPRSPYLPQPPMEQPTRPPYLPRVPHQVFPHQFVQPVLPPRRPSQLDF